MERWLSIVGIGDSGLDDLPDRTRALVDGAEVLVGGARHFAMLGDDDRERIPWRTPLLDVVADIKALRGKPVCVLATGDPMFFGIGVTLARAVPLAEMIIVPAPSAFSLVCARLGWPLAEVETITLHGRPLALLNAYLQPGARLLILSDDGRTPSHVAKALAARKYGASRMWVFAHMDGRDEKLTEGTAANWRGRKIADLNTIAVECVAEAGAPLLPRVPGLPDDAFAHDGQITKRAVRAATLAALAPVSGQLLWDVGAGSGAIAIEWMRAAPGARAIAIEREPKRLKLITGNAMELGVPGIEIVAGEAPAALESLDRPDAIFVGGGTGDDALLEACWAALPTGGRLVANVVTLEGEEALLRWRVRTGGGLARIAVSHAAPVGRLTGWRPLRAVTQLSAVKS